jgi:hypothetical protein
VLFESASVVHVGRQVQGGIAQHLPHHEQPPLLPLGYRVRVLSS